jgi:hypothetical protein
MGLRNLLFETTEGLITKLCESIGRAVQDQQTIYTDGDPYLTRYYLRRRRKSATDNEAQGLVSIYLHYFHRGDEDWALHNHPWKISLSLILTNGYVEERWVKNGIRKRKIRPGSFNIIRWSDFHRVELNRPDRGAWTLFITGPRVQEDWGFWHPKMPQFVPWQQFTRSRDHAQPASN